MQRVDTHIVVILRMRGDKSILRVKEIYVRELDCRVSSWIYHTCTELNSAAWLTRIVHRSCSDPYSHRYICTYLMTAHKRLVRMVVSIQRIVELLWLNAKSRVKASVLP